ncbi:MAG TPA: ABC transporter permease [Bellilinea sp.]|nr:ABC transporter permease [Bellilinea sp.]
MNAFSQHFSFEFRTGIRNKTLLLMNYLFPLGFFAMMGAIMPSVNPLFLQDLLPAMVVFAVLSATFLGIPDPLVNGRENGVFRSYRINGIPSFSILIIPVLTTLLHLAIVTAIITLGSGLVFKAPLPVNWPNFVLVFLVLALNCAAFAVLIGVVSPTSRATVLWSQLLFVPSMLLGGLMLPHSMLPEAALKFAQLLPASHAMNAFIGLVMGRESAFSAWGSVGVLAASAVIAFSLAIFLFSWDSRNAKRRGHPLLALLVFVPAVIGILVF